VSTFDYFADDEDPSQPKSSINALLSAPYVLEGASAAAIALFFFINTVVLGSA
jgi:hypothetical protein